MDDQINYESAYGKFSVWVGEDLPNRAQPIKYDMGGTIVGGALMKAFKMDTPIFNQTHHELFSAEKRSLEEFFDNPVDSYFLSVMNARQDVSELRVNYVAIFDMCDPKLEPSTQGKYTFLGTYDYDEKTLMSLM